MKNVILFVLFLMLMFGCIKGKRVVLLSYWIFFLRGCWLNSLKFCFWVRMIRLYCIYYWVMRKWRFVCKVKLFILLWSRLGLCVNILMWIVFCIYVVLWSLILEVSFCWNGKLKFWLIMDCNSYVVVYFFYRVFNVCFNCVIVMIFKFLIGVLGWLFFGIIVWVKLCLVVFCKCFCLLGIGWIFFDKLILSNIIRWLFNVKLCRLDIIVINIVRFELVFSIFMFFIMFINMFMFRVVILLWWCNIVNSIVNWFWFRFIVIWRGLFNWLLLIKVCILISKGWLFFWVIIIMLLGIGWL